MKRLGECDAVQKRKLRTRNHVFVRVYMSNRTTVVTCAPFLKNENGNPSVRKWKQHIPPIFMAFCRVTISKRSFLYQRKGVLVLDVNEKKNALSRSAPMGTSRWEPLASGTIRTRIGQTQPNHPNIVHGQPILAAMARTSLRPRQSTCKSSIGKKTYAITVSNTQFNGENAQSCISC